MNRIQTIIENWYNERINNSSKLKYELTELEEKEERLTEKIVKSFASNNIYELLSKEIKKIASKKKILEKEIEKSKCYITEDFIYSEYKQFDYLDNEIVNDNELKFIISMLLDEFNHYANSIEQKKDYNKRKNKSKNQASKKIKLIDLLLSELPPVSEGWKSIFEKNIYNEEDIILRDSLISHKKKIEKILSTTRINDDEHYRSKVRKILITIHQHYNIKNKKTEVAQLIKGLRPSLF